MPMLAVMNTSVPATVNGSRSTSMRRSAAAFASASVASSSSRMPNSSPPHLLIVSPTRTEEARRERDLLQEQVANVMPEGVVDSLETVEVEVQHRERSPPAGGLLQRVLHAVGEQCPVRQIGEWVVEGLVRELLLEGFAFGDVACVEDDAGHSGVVEKAVAEDLGVAPPAIAAADAQLGRNVGSLPLHRRVDETRPAPHGRRDVQGRSRTCRGGRRCRARRRDRSRGSGT